MPRLCGASGVEPLGGPGGIRTLIHLLAKQPLYRLELQAHIFTTAVLPRIELGTRRFSVCRSTIELENQSSGNTVV